MNTQNHSNHIINFSRLKDYIQVIFIFCLAFLVLTLWESSSYYHSTKVVQQNMTKISNLHSHINPYNLDRFKQRKLIFYNKDCPTCKKIIPKYYGASYLVDTLSFHAKPIYLEIHSPDNMIMASQLNIDSTPKQTQILNIDYDSSMSQINNLTQKQSSVQVPNTLYKLIMLDIFWSALLALIYLIIIDIYRYLISHKHPSRHD